MNHLIYIYIYIYIYTVSSTDRLFRCITTHQRGETREMLQAEVETRLTLRQSDILPENYRQPQHEGRNLTYMYYFHLFIGTLNGYRSGLFIRRALHYATGNRYFLERMLNKDYVSLCWLPNTGPSMCRSTQENVTYKIVLGSPAVPCMFRSFYLNGL